MDVKLEVVIIPVSVVDRAKEFYKRHPMPTASTQHAVAQPVDHADYVQLSRLVIEVAWRVDLGAADTLYGLFTEDGTLTIGNTVLERPAPQVPSASEPEAVTAA